MNLVIHGRESCAANAHTLTMFSSLETELLVAETGLNSYFFSRSYPCLDKYKTEVRRR